MVSLLLFYIAWLPGGTGPTDMPPVVEYRYSTMAECQQRKGVMTSVWSNPSVGKMHLFHIECVGEGGGYAPTPGMPDICYIEPWQAPEACNYYPNQPPVVSSPPGQDGEWPGLHASPNAPGAITRGVAWEMGRTNP